MKKNEQCSNLRKNTLIYRNSNELISIECDDLGMGFLRFFLFYVLLEFKKELEN